MSADSLALDQDTIAAIATPSGRGGVSVIRVSGPEAKTISERLTKRTLLIRQPVLSKFFGADGHIIDEVVLCHKCIDHITRGRMSPRRHMTASQRLQSQQRASKETILLHFLQQLIQRSRELNKTSHHQAKSRPEGWQLPEASPVNRTKSAIIHRWRSPDKNLAHGITITDHRTGHDRGLRYLT